MSDITRRRRTPRRGGGRPPRHPGTPARLTRQDKGKAKVGEPIDLTPDDDDNEEQRLPIDLTADDADVQGRLPIDLTADDADVQQRLPVDLTGDDDNEQQRLPVDLTGDDDNEQQSYPNDDLSFSILLEDYCFTRTLTRDDVDPTDPRIRIDSYEAMNLTGNPSLLELPESGNFTKKLSMFDDNLFIYDMVLSEYVMNGWVGYSICGDWGLFVRSHELKVGDRIFFYMKEDMNVVDPYYDIKVARKPIEAIPPVTGLTDVDVNVNPLEAEYIRKLVPGENWTPDEKSPPGESWSPEEHSPPGGNWLPGQKSPDHKRKPGPGSRVLTGNNICLSKYLLDEEVDHVGGNPILFLSDSNAGTLIGCGNMKAEYSNSTLLENLMVFDADDRQYDMLLSHCAPNIHKASYSIDAGWQRFVHIHNLKKDDVISFHRLTDETINDEPYYVVRYTCYPGGTGVGPSGSAVSPSVIEVGQSGSGVGPGGTGVDPSGSAVSPSVIEVGPSGSGVGPSGTGVDPSGSGVSPGVIEVDPSGARVDLSGSEVGPNGSGVSPSVIEVGPSGSGVSEVGPSGSGHKEES